MFHQFPPTNNTRHLIDKNLHLLATRFYRLDSVMYYFINGLRAEIKREVLMHLPKDYLTAVNLASRTEFVDRTIADSRSRKFSLHVTT